MNEEQTKSLAFQKMLFASQSEASPDGILLVSNERKWLSFNRRFIEMWRISEQVAAVGDSHVALQSVKEQLANPERFLARIEDLYKHPDEQAHDEVRLKDGRIFEQYSSPVRDEEGVHYGRVWYYRDITEHIRTEERLRHQRAQLEQEIAEHKQTEKALREHQQRYQALFEQTNDAVFIIGPDLTLGTDLIHHAVNQQAADLLGYTVEELLQMPIKNIVAPETWDSSMQVVRTLKKEGSVSVYERVMIKKDGTRIWVEINPLQVYDDEGQPQHILSIVRDISERKQAEAALQQAKEAAELANQAKSQFLATMSHELRTPLNGILGYAQILQRDTAVSPSHRLKLNIIEQNGRHLLMLINDILDLAKIEAGKIELHEAEFNLPTFLYNIGEFMRFRAEEKGLIFHFESGPLPTAVYSDQKRLRQVLINLLGNAIKFTDRGHVTFRIELTETETSPETPHFRFLVEDSGRGISRDDLQTIFDPFQQAGDRKYRAEGTGLGLAISQTLIELMGGELHVKSRPGEGSTFWFDIPLATSRDWQAKTAAALPNKDTQTEQTIDYQLPPRAELLILNNLALQGDVSAIRQRAPKLIETDEVLEPFAIKLRQLAENFQVNQICEWLARCLQE